MDNIVTAERKLNKYEVKFIILFVLTLLIAFSPSTPLGQISAVIFLVGAIFFVQIRPSYHLKKYIVIFISYSLIGIVFWLIYQQEFSFVNYYLFFVTSSSFLFIFFDFRPIISDRLLERLGQIVLVFIFAESIIGVFQAVYVFMRAGTFDGSVGDFVWGTLAPPFNTAYAGRSPSFILLITTLILFSLAVFRRRWSPKYIIAYSTVLLAWLFASLMHSFLYFGLAAILALLTLVRVNVKKKKQISTARSKQKKGITYGAAVVFFAIVFLLVLVPRFLPNNTAKISNALNEVFSLTLDAKYLKIRAINNTILALPQDAWLQPFVGVGPGQYASRAALMATGQYLARPIPGLPEHINSYTSTYILPHLNVINSSLHFPSSSWLAVYGELGLVGLILILIVIAKAILFFRRYRSKQFRMLNLMMLILIYYLVFMSFQNVYLEYTQAVFPAILSLKLCFDYLHNEFELSRSPKLRIKATVHRRAIG